MAQDQGSDTRFLNSMMRFRTVHLVGDINDRMVGDVIDRLLDLQLQASDPIRLVINSRGGSRDSAMSLHDVICYALSAPVHAIVIGHCCSAATFVLLACKVRLAMPHARFVVHSGTFSGISIKTNEMSLTKASRVFDEIKKGANEVLTFYAAKLDKSREEVQKLIDRGDEQYDNQMTADEAKAIGLITNIITENLGIFPPQENSSNKGLPG